jgi:heat shock protein HspQ
MNRRGPNCKGSDGAVSAVQAKFSVGQLVHHKLFDYRGVVVDVDPHFLGTEDWYADSAKTRPPKDRPWYHVLVDESAHQTYVAERNLEADGSDAPVRHPKISAHFSGRGADGAYKPKRLGN